MKILFVGSGRLGIPTLQALAKSSHTVVGVVAGAPKAQGRGRKVKEQAIHSLGRELGFKVFNPVKVNAKESVEELRALKPDVTVVASYGAFLSEEFVKIASKECMNVHPSLLPQYRGASPVAGALLAGEKETGMSIIRVSNEMDGGDILLQEKISLKGDENARDVTHHLAGIGAKLILKALDLIDHGSLSARPQSHDEATYAKKIKAQDARIDWSKTAFQIHNQIRAFYEWPGSYTLMDKKKLKILKTRQAVGCAASETKPGAVLEASSAALRVQTGDGSLCVEEIQPEGSRAMDYKAFLNGHPLKEGFVFE